MDTTPNSKPEQEKKWYYRKNVIIIVFIIVIATIAAIIYWFINYYGYVTTDDASVDSHRMTISSKIPGRIKFMAVDEGDTVSRGKLLIQLDTVDAKAQELLAAANVEVAKQNVAHSQTILLGAQQDFNRVAVQYSKKIIPKEQFDRFKQQLDAAIMTDNQAHSQLNAAKAQLNVTQVQLCNTKIYSESRGVVARRWVECNDVVQASQPIYTVYDDRKVWVTINLQETSVADVKPGDPVIINVDTYTRRHFEGRVLVVGSAAASEFSLLPPSNASGNFTKVTQRIPCKISIREVQRYSDIKPAILRPGMSVEVKIRVK
jgi:membrane fusion protein (multidrug efflux system)